jgi:hypothetical protein
MFLVYSKVWHDHDLRSVVSAILTQAKQFADAFDPILDYFPETNIQNSKTFAHD